MTRSYFLKRPSSWCKVFADLHSLICVMRCGTDVKSTCILSMHAFMAKAVLASTWRKSCLPFDKKRRTSSLRGAYAFLIWSIMRALFHDDFAAYRQYFINIAGSLILFMTILISANWALRWRWRRPSGHLPTSGLSGNRCRRYEGLRLPTGCRWCCR